MKTPSPLDSYILLALAWADMTPPQILEKIANDSRSSYLPFEGKGHIEARNNVLHLSNKGRSALDRESRRIRQVAYLMQERLS
jgi:hypothetical protein